MKDLKINYLFYSGQYHIPYEKWVWAKYYVKGKIKEDYTNYYQISNYGRGQAVNRHIIDSKQRTTLYKHHFLRPHFIHSKKYRTYKGNMHLSFHLSKNNHCHVICIHKLVKESFDSPTPLGYEISHNDQDPHNNWLSNLQWRTFKEHHNHDNLSDKISGENNGKIKVLDKQVKEIINLHHTNKFTITELSVLFNIPRSTINNWISGRRRQRNNINES